MADNSVPNLQAAIQGWTAALAADALDPQPHYNADGEMIDPEAWRNSLLQNVQDAQKIINQRKPFNSNRVRARSGGWW